MEKNVEIERNLGEQPIAALMKKHDLNASNLVEASRVPVTYKLVSRACKGRRLTTHSKKVVLEALQIASGHPYKVKELFNY